MELTTTVAQTAERLHVDDIMRVERAVFAAKLRAARAVLGLSQDQLAHSIGLTQRSIHRIEQGEVQPKLRTILTIERFLTSQGIMFENSRDGFRLIVDSAALLRD